MRLDYKRLIKYSCDLVSKNDKKKYEREAKRLTFLHSFKECISCILASFFWGDEYGYQFIEYIPY